VSLPPTAGARTSAFVRARGGEGETSRLDTPGRREGRFLFGQVMPVWQWRASGCRCCLEVQGGSVSRVALSTLGGGPPDPRSITSTAELCRRPSRPPDHEAENRALIALAQGDGALARGPSAKARGDRPELVSRALGWAQPAGGGGPEEKLPLARHCRAMGPSPGRRHAARLWSLRHSPGS
jgi:hypothetical protein